MCGPLLPIGANFKVANRITIATSATAPPMLGFNFIKAMTVAIRSESASLNPSHLV